MVLFAMRFLPGTHGIAIINTSPDPGVLPTFQCVRILEFATPVCEDQGESGGKGSSPYGMFDGIKNGFHMTGLFAVHKVSHHKGAAVKMKGQYHLTGAFTAKNGIHLRDPGVRKLL